MSEGLAFALWWGGAILLGVIMGFLTYWIFDHDIKE